MGACCEACFDQERHETVEVTLKGGICKNLQQCMQLLGRDTETRPAEQAGQKPAIKPANFPQPEIQHYRQMIGMS